MRRWTITATTTIVVLIACGQPENLEDRLIEAEKRLALAEERIAAYEREAATATPDPTTTATLTPDPTTTAGPTPTALYGGQPTATPTPSSNATPTATPTLLSVAGLTIRERYEELARVELVVRTEERRTLSGCNDPAMCNVSDWRYEDVVLFTVPKGLGGWVIRFTEVPGPDGYSSPKKGDLFVYHPSNPGSNLGYIRAHNIWAHIMQLYSGRVAQWPR